MEVHFTPEQEDQLSQIATQAGTDPASFCFRPIPYVAVYGVSKQTIEVLRIYHAAQDR